MTATQLRRKVTTKSSTPSRPVTAVLLELVYLMHATKIVGQRETPLPRRSQSRSI